MSYTIKHHTDSDTKTILDPDGWELITIRDLHKELNELLHRAKAAEAERDELMRELSEARVKEHTISAAQAKASAITANTLCVQPDWQRVRIDAAIAAMHAILSQKNYGALLEFSDKSACDARAALEYSNELIVHLAEILE